MSARCAPKRVRREKRTWPSPIPKSKARRKNQFRDALVRLSTKKPFADISVTELCREAQLGRTTFYLHYRNTKEVYDDAVRVLITSVKTHREGMSCERQRENDRPAFCAFIRRNPERAGIVNDPQFVQTVIQLSFENPEYNQVARLMERGLTQQQAIAVYTFQMSGCCAMATSTAVQDDSFRQCRQTIDVFLRAGIDAVCPRLDPARPSE